MASACLRSRAAPDINFFLPNAVRHSDGGDIHGASQQLGKLVEFACDTGPIAFPSASPGRLPLGWAPRRSPLRRYWNSQPPYRCSVLPYPRLLTDSLRRTVP